MAGLPGQQFDSDGSGSSRHVVPQKVPESVRAAMSEGNEDLLELDSEISELRRLERSAKDTRRRGSLVLRIEKLEDQRGRLLTGQAPDPTVPFGPEGSEPMSARGTRKGSRLKSGLASFAEADEDSSQERDHDAISLASSSHPASAATPPHSRRKTSTAMSVSSVMTPSGISVVEGELPEDVQIQLAELRKQDRGDMDRERRRLLTKQIDDLITRAAAEMDSRLSEAPPDYVAGDADTRSIPSLSQAGSRRMLLDIGRSSSHRTLERKGSNRSLDLGSNGGASTDTPPRLNLKRQFTGGLERAMSNRSLQALLENEAPPSGGSLSSRSQMSDRKAKLTKAELSLAGAVAKDVVSSALSVYSSSPRSRQSMSARSSTVSITAPSSARKATRPSGGSEKLNSPERRTRESSLVDDVIKEESGGASGHNADAKTPVSVRHDSDHDAQTSSKSSGCCTIM